MLKSLFQSTADPGSGNFTRAELTAIAGKMPDDLRPIAAEYLRSAPLIIPWMESTQDILEGRFRVAGGSATYVDGEYYWRLDTAEYVEIYGIGLPAEFIAHAEAQNWKPPEFDEFQELEFYEELEHIMEEYSQRNGTVASVQTFYPSYWEPDDPRRRPEL